MWRAQGVLRILLASLGFSLCRRLRRYCLVDLHIGHLEFAKQVQEETLFFLCEIALGFFVQSVEHVDQFARGFRIDHWLARPRIGIRAKHHGRVLSEHANEIFERAEAWGRFCRRWSNRSFGLPSGWGRRFCSLPLGFALLFLDNILAQFALRGERAAVYNAERFVLFVVRQGTFLNNPFNLSLSLARLASASRRNAL
jgi:hypothetical protein